MTYQHIQGFAGGCLAAFALLFGYQEYEKLPEPPEVVIHLSNLNTAQEMEAEKLLVDNCSFEVELMPSGHVMCVSNVSRLKGTRIVP